METNFYLKTEIMKVVDKQIEGLPEVKITFDRLVNSGYDEQTAKEMIAAILVEEIQEMLQNKNKHDKEQYIRKLRKLK